jgi:hypothetical protein
VHNFRDPDVPASHEAVYAEIVARAGCSDFLVQHVIADGFGHTDGISAEDHIKAFGELVNWVKTGAKPAPW